MARQAGGHDPHTAGEHPAIGLRRLLMDHPDIKVEIVVDYSLTDIVTEGYDAGTTPAFVSASQVAKDMIAVRIGPDIGTAVVGAPAYPKPKTPQHLTSRNCINMRLPTCDGLVAWVFEKNGHELKVRVEGKSVVNNMRSNRRAHRRRTAHPRVR